MSKGEDKIEKILIRENIKYKREYSIEGCNSTHHNPMRFDFGVFEEGGDLKYLIEFQGIQHYDRVQKFQKTRDQFLKTQARDRQKCSFALAHNIPLYCIPFWELNDIESESDITALTHLVRNRFHNDDVKLPQ